MKRRWTGFLTAVGIVLFVDFSIIGIIGIDNINDTSAWWCVNLPALPFLSWCVPFVPLTPGDDNIPQIRLLVISMTFWSCVTWGVIGYWVGRVNENPRLLARDECSEGEPKLPDVE
jgi:hypothetical protein